ncbi:MAG TPA: DUF47 family protein [Candidatus Bathyarchaeota archaeon]|nr:DUF47 family protein [Candidatus Bathyarchaeota archaeon]
MVFPVESEDRTMRTLIMLCQDNTRLIVNAFRIILTILDSVKKGEGEGVSEKMGEVEELIEKSNDIRGSLLKELHEIGGVLVSRDDFFRLISTFGDILDHIYSIGQRLSAMEQRGWKPPAEALEKIEGVADLAFDALLKLREAMMSMGFNSTKAIGFTKEIDAIERKVDSVHVQVEMDIMESEAEVHILLMLKDTVYQIEELVDTVRDTSDLIRIISL